MKRIRTLAVRLVCEEDGTEALEWGLVAALIVIGSIVAMKAIGPKVKIMWNNVNASIK